MSRSRGRAPSQRQLRVGEEIRHSLARILMEEDLHQPELAELTITVTEVRMSPDLKNATVFVTPLGGKSMAAAVEGLRKAMPFLRHALASSLNLRFTPRLSFQPDRSFDEAERVDALLRRERVRHDIESGENDISGDGVSEDEAAQDDGEMSRGA